MNFQEFKNIITNDMLADENELKQFLNQALPKIPEPNSNVICNTVIERAVLVDKSYGEFDVSRLSYIPINIASQTFPHRGRFNNVGEPHFYGALSDVIDSARTRYYLATEIEQSILGEQTKSFNYTVAWWKVIKDFKAILYMFAPDFAHNVELESAYKQYINSREYAELSEEQREFLKLITCEFAKSKPANGYAVSNIVFDYYKSKGYQSIAYPGIQSKYRANNIAITPYIVDNNLVCYQAAEFCLCQTEAGDISIRHAYKIEIEDNHRLKYSSFNESEIGENIKLEI